MKTLKLSPKFCTYQWKVIRVRDLSYRGIKKNLEGGHGYVGKCLLSIRKRKKILPGNKATWRQAQSHLKILGNDKYDNFKKDFTSLWKEPTSKPSLRDFIKADSNWVSSDHSPSVFCFALVIHAVPQELGPQRRVLVLVNPDRKNETLPHSWTHILSSKKFFWIFEFRNFLSKGPCGCLMGFFWVNIEEPTLAK